MSEQGWPGPTATKAKAPVEPPQVPARTTRLYRIAELIGRYKPEHDTKTGRWHLWDAEKHERTPSEYHDEDTARAGARLAAACEIDALYDEVKS